MVKKKHELETAIENLTLSSATVDINGDGAQQSLTLGTATPITVDGQVIGNLSVGGDGSYSFVPVADYNGSVPQVTYTLEDEHGGRDTAVLNITVNNTCISILDKPFSPSKYYIKYLPLFLIKRSNLFINFIIIHYID